VVIRLGKEEKKIKAKKIKGQKEVGGHEQNLWFVFCFLDSIPFCCVLRLETFRLGSGGQIQKSLFERI
jgi:hypothetical protein